MTAVAALRRAVETQPLLAVGASTALFALGPVIIQAADASGPVVSFWRLWIGLVLLGGATVVHRHRTGHRPSAAGWAWAAAAGVAFAVNQLGFMIALKRTTVVDVTLMNTLAPIFVGVLAARVFGERPGTRFRAWSVVAVSGAAAVAVAGSSGPGGDAAGMALAAGSVVGFSVYLIVSKVGRDHIDVAPFLFGAGLAAALVVTAFVLITGEDVAAASRRDLLLCLTLAIGPGAIGHALGTWPMRWVPANVPPLFHLTIPLVAGLLAWLVLGESTDLARVAAGAVMVVGVAGAVRSIPDQSPAMPLISEEP